MQSEMFGAWLSTLLKSITVQNERRLVILSGCELWAKTLLDDVGFTNKELNSSSSSHRWLVYGDSKTFTANVQAKRYQDKLGSECDFIVFADSRFTIDALAALSGTLKAGGVLFFIAQPLKEQDDSNAFSKRFFTLLKKFPEHYIINQTDVRLPCASGFQTENSLADDSVSNYQDLIDEQCVTSEQQEAVVLIKKVLTGHRKRPLVLTADRGRGKSSALAIACAQLLLNNQGSQNNPFTILITAPERQSLTVFFKQLITDLPDARLLDHKVYHLNGSVEFVAVDRLLAGKPQANLLLVDEAAGVPVYLLEQLLSHYHRMVFASTVHGYEGAGRGFTLKFQKTLSLQCPQWRNFHMNEPIRWRNDDPLERFIFQSCLLNSELALLNSSQQLLDTETSFIERIHTSQLLSNEELLADVFSILVTAHYQTKPSDLMLLLNNNNIQLICLFGHENKKQLLGVALLIQEGNWGNDAVVTHDEVEAVASSKRRLSNHFLPQSLFVHCGCENSFNHRYLRIMRIAVHPELQQQGFGSVFVQELIADAKSQGVDFLGTSFGATPQLLSFWFKHRFSAVRIGFTQDKASGEHSALLLNSLSPNSDQVVAELQHNFYRSFNYLLLDEYRTLSTELVLLVLSKRGLESSPLTYDDLHAAKAFATGKRVYSSCAYSLYLWFEDFIRRGLVTFKVQHRVSNASHSTEESVLIKKLSSSEPVELVESDDMIMMHVFTCRLIQKHSIDQVCKRYGFTGKKMLNKAMMNFVNKHLASKTLLTSIDN
jgi:tRNA(Met) cytidine acetyltransferase